MIPARTRTPKRSTVERGCLTGYGQTKTEAKADMDAKIDAALSGYYRVHVVRYGEHSAIVYRTPYGWGYRRIDASELAEPGITSIDYDTHYDTELDAVQAAAFHVVDLGSDLDEFHADADIPAFLECKNARATVLSNARFQRAYAYAKANSPDGADCDHRWHQWACENSRDPRFT